MPLVIIDKKKVDLTADEETMYRKIVRSYTTLTNKGEDLFMDLFETDDQGIIIFLKPPHVRQTSLEVFLFLMSIMQHQHLRQMHAQIDDMVAQVKENINKK